VSALQARLGLVGPNQHFTPTDWWALGASGARTIVLLWPDHNRADAAVCHALGMTVWVRLPGEGRPQVADAAAAIAEFAGVAHGLLLGNEPLVDELWQHCWYVEKILNTCGAAPTVGIDLPGLAGEHPVPVDAALADRLAAVYGRCAVLGVHAYAPWTLAAPEVLARLDAWHAFLPDKPMLLSEVGIAGRWPLGPGNHDQTANDQEKVRRLLAFLAALPPYVTAACWFLLGGSNDWEAFTEPGVYDPAGGNRYSLTAPAWALLGQQVRTP
jgi:hypothetical protein